MGAGGNARDAGQRLASTCTSVERLTLFIKATYNGTGTADKPERRTRVLILFEWPVLTAHAIVLLEAHPELQGMSILYALRGIQPHAPAIVVQYHRSLGLSLVR